MAVPRGFGHVDTWVFDLDNTLYPSECNLFAQVDQRMGAFVAKYLGVPEPYARHLQKSYYRQFGTTLSGLMAIHKMEPKPFESPALLTRPPKTVGSIPPMALETPLSFSPKWLAAWATSWGVM